VAPGGGVSRGAVADPPASSVQHGPAPLPMRALTGPCHHHHHQPPGRTLVPQLQGVAPAIGQLHARRRVVAVRQTPQLERVRVAAASTPQHAQRERARRRRQRRRPRAERRERKAHDDLEPAAAGAARHAGARRACGGGGGAVAATTAGRAPPLLLLLEPSPRRLGLRRGPAAAAA
jgi:hypothetical protein